MTLIQYNNMLKTGVQQFDEDHCRLVDITNELYDAMKEGNGTQALESIFERLLAYTSNHFEAEELLLLQHGYPEFEVHKQAHQEIIQKLTAIIAQHSNGQAPITASIVQFLFEWLISHTKGVDSRYGPFFNSRGIY